MAAATADVNTNRREGIKCSLPVKGTKTLYAGTLLCTDASGYVISGADGANNTFIGVASEYVDNSAGDSGDLNIEVWLRGSGQVFEFAYSGVTGTVTQAMLNTTAYVNTNQEVSYETNGTVCANGVSCGRIVELDITNTKVWVQI
jgi:hypothetical protein